MASQNMNILYLTPYIPYPPFSGGKIRVFNLLKNLVRNHSVHLLCLVEREKERTFISSLKQECGDNLRVSAVLSPPKKSKLDRLWRAFSHKSYRYVRYYSPEMQRLIDKVLREERFDLVQVEHSYMAYYDFNTDIPLILAEQNLEFDIVHQILLRGRDAPRRIYSLWEYSKFKREEIELCRKFTKCLVVSEEDKERLTPFVSAERIEVVPNGVDTELFKPANSGDKKGILYITGPAGYYPNVCSAQYFCEEIYPQLTRYVPYEKINIVGRDLPRPIQKLGERDEINLLGFVEDIREPLSSCAVTIVPLYIGGGTHLKTLEAMAMGTPVVSTHLGGEGLGITPGEEAMITDDPEDFALQVKMVLDDKKLQEKLSIKGRKLVEEKYDWRKITDGLEGVYKRLLK